jgi:hypothetical protein
MNVRSIGGRRRKRLAKGCCEAGRCTRWCMDLAARDAHRAHVILVALS